MWPSHIYLENDISLVVFIFVYHVIKLASKHYFKVILD